MEIKEKINLILKYLVSGFLIVVAFRFFWLALNDSKTAHFILIIGAVLIGCHFLSFDRESKQM